jgi:hypothetical protein
MSAIGAVMRFDKIENALSVAASIREQRRQQQEALDGKLLANEMGLTELRKLADSCKGEEIFEELEAVVLMKEKECKQTRKLVAEAINEWGISSSKNKKDSTTQRAAVTQRVAVPKVVVPMKERKKLVALARNKLGSSTSKSKNTSATRWVVAPCA